MLSVNSILSLDQGKLLAHLKTEDAYYARFVTRDAPKPSVEKRRAWHFLGLEWGGYPVENLK